MSPNAASIAALPAFFCLPGSVGLEGRLLDGADHVPASKLASRGRLFVLLEPEHDDEGMAAVAKAALKSIMQQFYADEHRHLAGSLVRALVNVNADLRRHNLLKPVRERAGVGVAAVVLRGDELQFCVVPPARAYVVQGGDLLSVGAGSYVGISSRAPFVRQMPLGLTDEVDPDLARVRAETGTVVVLCSPQLGRLLLSLDEDELIALGDAEAIANRVRDMARSRELMGGAFMAVDIVAPAASRARSARMVDRLVQVASSFLGGKTESASSVEVVSSLIRKRSLNVESAPGSRGRLRPSGILARMTGILGAFGSISFPRMLRREPLPRLRYVEPRLPVRKGRRWIRYLLLALLAMAVVAVGVKVELDRTQAARVEQLLTEAQRLNQEAAQERDAAVAQEKLKRASELLDEAARTQVGSERVGSLLSQVDENLEALSGIYRLRLPRLILDASPLGEKSRLWRVASASGHLYILDQGLAAVLDFDQGAQQVVQILGAGDIVEGVQVGNPVALGASGGGLWVLDDKFQIFLGETSGQNWRAVRIPGSQDWGAVLDVAYWGGSIYILTGRPSQIYRVDLGQIGAGGEPWLDNPADAEQATALAVDERIYLLTADGRIQRAVRGAVDAIFELKLDPPLAGASQVFTWSGVGSIFIVDPARERIVEVSKDGKNVRQLLRPSGSKLLSDIRSISYDVSTNTLYLVTAHQLWAAQIPPWK